MIEVKSADASKHPPLDVVEVIGGQRGRNSPGSQNSPSPAPAPPAPSPEAAAPTAPTVQVMPPEPPTTQIPTGPFSGYAQQAPASVQVVEPTAPPRYSGGPQLDWGAIVAELQAMAEDALGNRARKVKDILGAADPSLAGIEAAIDQIPSISLLFVDSSRLEQLAQEMRARLKSHL
jgi:hypothetical protein